MKERARLRKMAGLTQIQLGRKIGKSGGTICLWERGELELAPTDVERIARVIDNELTKRPPVSGVAQITGALAAASA